MVQWNTNVDSILVKVLLVSHNIRIDWKKLESGMRAEGIDVTAKGIMHRITKMKTTQFEHPEPGKASPFKTAKRYSDGKMKTVHPDTASDEPAPEDEKPKPKRAKKGRNSTPAKDMTEIKVKEETGIVNIFDDEDAENVVAFGESTFVQDEERDKV